MSTRQGVQIAIVVVLGLFISYLSADRNLKCQCSAEEAQGVELGAVIWVDDGLKIEPTIIKVVVEPKQTIISWKERGPASVQIVNSQGVIVEEIKGENSVTWDGTWASKDIPAQNGPYGIEVRIAGKIVHKGTVYVDNPGPAPNALYMATALRAPRWKEDQSEKCKTNEDAEFMYRLRYGTDPCFLWWWGVEKEGDKPYVWDNEQKKYLDPEVDNTFGCYFLSGRFIFQIARDPEFKEIVHQSRWRAKPWGINVTLKPGKYYYRLVGMDEQGNPVYIKKDTKTGKEVSYTSQVVPFEYDPLPVPEKPVVYDKVKDMSRKEFESYAFSPEEVASWGPAVPPEAGPYTKDNIAYWTGKDEKSEPLKRWKVERSMLSARLSKHRRIGAFEMAFSEQAYYPDEDLIVVFKLNSDAVIDENIKDFSPPRQTYYPDNDFGNYYDYIKNRATQGLDDPDNVLRLGLVPEKGGEMKIHFEVVSRKDGQTLYKAVLPVIAKTSQKLPDGATHCELSSAELSAFDNAIAYKIDISALPIALAGTKQYIGRATLLESGKPLHTISRTFGRTQHPTLYRLPWGKMEVNDDGSLYIKSRPVFPHSVIRAEKLATSCLHGFNAYWDEIPGAPVEKLQSLYVTGGVQGRAVTKWMAHEPNFDQTFSFWHKAKEMTPEDNRFAMSTTPGGWTGEAKVFDFLAAEGTGFKRPIVVLPYQHVGGPELTAFHIDTGMARRRALERMGVPTLIYTEGGLYRIGENLSPPGIEEIMATLYISIIHGCRSFDWFAEWTHENKGSLSHMAPETYSQFYRVLAAQINWLQPIICAHRVEQDVSIWPKKGEVLKKIHDGKTYLFAVRYGPGQTIGGWKWKKIDNIEAHYHDPAKGFSTHAVHFGINTPLKPESVIRQKVYLDPQNPPKTIGVQMVNRNLYGSKWFIVEDWEHSAFWGDNDKLNIGLGPFNGSPHQSNVPMGKLPPAGKWVTLEIPIDKIGLNHFHLDDGWQISGVAFDTVGGRVFWGDTIVTTEDGRETTYFTRDEIERCVSADETMKITVPGLKAGKSINVLFEGRQLTAKDGYFEDGFSKNDYATHIYEIP